MSWPLVNLSAVCQIDMGSAPKGSTYVELDKGVPLIAGAADYGDVFPRPKKATLEPTKLCEEGDIIICVRATIGDLNWADKEYCLGRGVAGLRVHYKKLDSKYLWYFIASIEDELYRNSTGSTFPQINKKIIEGLQIPLPPLETQKQIAAVLEKADQLRKDCQQMEQELNSLAQSVFIEMFGDPVTNPKEWEIGIISDLLSSANYGTSEKSSTEILKYPVLRMNNLTYEGNWDFTSLKYMDMDEKDEEKYLVQNGDILFNRTNSKELVGKTAVYRENKLMAYAGYLVRARCNELGHPDYISSFMNSKYGKQTLQSMCKSIVGMANINAKEFQSINIAKPPIKLQLDFSIRIAKIRALIQEAKLQEAQYESAFNALMQKAFNGELNLDNANT
ncbi:restriction endonuclease subunit S [Shewanella sp. MEBiC00475]|uniref:restriction endonuclease subunit S n=1 Tax=Shewanella sp. MEBiC00475 TaxID=2575361 RepID=UPI0010C0FFBC|nr:restriction endonuclease subunit S [Shewanella sp. MEBiC00475]